jgi:hypothetical protein
MPQDGLDIKKREKDQPGKWRPSVIAIFWKQPHLFRLYSTLAFFGRCSTNIAPAIESGTINASKSNRLSVANSTTAATIKNNAAKFDFITIPHPLAFWSR